MPDVEVIAVLLAVGVVLVALYLRTRGPRPVDFRDEREERLARRTAREVGGSVAGVLSAVRRELELAPTQSDDTLVKRAAYHYRQELPERTCQVYRDRAPG